MRRVLGSQARQGNERRSPVASKRVGLIRPVHVAERASVAAKMVFRLLVVAHHHFQDTDRVRTKRMVFLRPAVHESDAPCRPVYPRPSVTSGWWCRSAGGLRGRCSTDPPIAGASTVLPA